MLCLLFDALDLLLGVLGQLFGALGLLLATLIGSVVGFVGFAVRCVMSVVGRITLFTFRTTENQGYMLNAYFLIFSK